jgi:hypothetical protein
LNPEFTETVQFRVSHLKHRYEPFQRMCDCQKYVEEAKLVETLWGE